MKHSRDYDLDRLMPQVPEWPDFPDTWAYRAALTVFFVLLGAGTYALCSASIPR